MRAFLASWRKVFFMSLVSIVWDQDIEPEQEGRYGEHHTENATASHTDR
jgi:hypothetical protein